MRRLLLLVLVVAACSPTPSTVPSEAAPSPTPTATVPSPTTAPPTNSPAPASIGLPAGFDNIPWAHVDGTTRLVTFGVLGHAATGTRVTDAPDQVAAAGDAVLFINNGLTWIVNAATGKTIATFDRSKLALPEPDPEVPNSILYQYASHRFVVDVDHGFLYDLAPSTSGIQLRRFSLDGSHATLLAILAPDPGREFWDHVDFVVGPAGEVDAVACPPAEAKLGDHRCRVWRIPAAAKPPFKPRFLSATAPRPCYLIAASERHLIAGTYEACHADGGGPDQLPYASIDLESLASTSVMAAADLTAFDVVDPPDTHTDVVLVGNLLRAWPWPDAYPGLAVAVEFGNAFDPVRPLIDEVRPGWVWALRGAGPDWRLLQSYGPDYSACLFATDDTSTCPVGPVVLEAAGQMFKLPAGTYGEITPPLGYGRY